MTTVFDELLSSVQGLPRAASGSSQSAASWPASTGSMPARALDAAAACLPAPSRPCRAASPASRPGRWPRLLRRAPRRLALGPDLHGRRFRHRSSSTITAGWRCSARAAISTIDKIAAGFLILGPGIVYPDHHHVAEEIYIPLTGGTDGAWATAAFRRREAGEIIHHRSNVSHAMRTGEEPLLALYLWRGGPLAPRSTITGTCAGQGLTHGAGDHAAGHRLGCRQDGAGRRALPRRAATAA